MTRAQTLTHIERKTGTNKKVPWKQMAICILNQQKKRMFDRHKPDIGSRFKYCFSHFVTFVVVAFFCDHCSVQTHQLQYINGSG